MRKNGGGKGHPLVHIGAGLIELVRDGVLNRFGQFGLVHHLADKVTIAFFRWHASRGGMRLAQVAHLGQRSHLIADGGRGKIKMVMLHQPLRADRLSSFDVIADDKKKKGLLAFGKFRHVFHTVSTLEPRVLFIGE